MIVVIADDLSGAAELAGVALDFGLTAEVQTAFSAVSEAEVICVDTDTRALTTEQAANVIGEVVKRVVAANPAWIYKKCDSVLRGPVLAEARAMAQTAGKVRVVIVAANPSRGRIVRGGRYFIEGVLLHETAFSRDPGHPRTTSRVAELLGGDLTGVTVPDVESMADVSRQAMSIDNETLPVGAADFFRALLHARVPRHAARRATRPELTGATLLVCGSVASWTQRRSEAIALGIPVFDLPYDVAAAVDGLRRARRIVVGVGDGPETREVAPADLAEKLAGAVAQILDATEVATVLSEGGATTAAVVRAMGWTRLAASEVAAEGVAALRPVGASRPLLLIKPGSYAWPKELWPPA